ncbi:PhzF family phenazine biosynthesis protein [Nocardia sp. CDC159]|uniref:PhzF family phenazine biosynthesis protein n=1 Tax=Nocardia pulmonis TaxID=2951408 RepID=A0A9X2ECW4_9NOCA|nr:MULTISPECIES: PhzF family phenazine biosynthesis protein [Nocardia]MCM6776928.1 PhzF family phenazine biosynthesis protein [Nocardia pulmonis]MCM6789352.1 PhzF family phenazine biosynthesis protein [Nocardia sp. CDC159]
MIEHEVVGVFCGPHGEFGNELGVVRAAPESDEQRRTIARTLGYSETVFIDDAAHGVIDIWTPSTRLPFAGHPCVGTAWLLGASTLTTRAGRVDAHRDGELSWVTAQPNWATDRTLRQYPTPAAVDELDVPPPGAWIYAWSWRDERTGRIRARAFPGRGDGIDEDEATGAAALLLTAKLDRPLVITQGRGSVIRTRPLPDGRIEIGGRVRTVTTPRR